MGSHSGPTVAFSPSPSTSYAYAAPALSTSPASIASMLEAAAATTMGTPMRNASRLLMASPNAEDGAIQQMRLVLTVMHLLLVCIGTVNLLVVFVIAARPYMRSITNVYMVSLCLADFMYLANLMLVAATQLNDKSWPFGSVLCTVYHGTETTGKYASVMFVVLLAADRYCAMCKPNICARYRNYRIALGITLIAWSLALIAAFPLFAYSEVGLLKVRGERRPHELCIMKWPSLQSARWYVTFSSILIFAAPLSLIIFFYYHILSKLRMALKSNRRMRRTSSSRAPYQRVTRLVLWVVIFHLICWTPFWLFNLVSSIFKLRIITQFDRIVVNVIHLFPYLNCALNPLVYAMNAENFRRAFRSLFCGICGWGRRGVEMREDSRYVANGDKSRSLGSMLNASSERLLSINYGAANGHMIQKCSNSSLLNGTIFLSRNVSLTPPPGPLAESLRRPIQRATTVADSFRRSSRNSMVRFATIDSESGSTNSPPTAVRRDEAKTQKVADSSIPIPTTIDSGNGSLTNMANGSAERLNGGLGAAPLEPLSNGSARPSMASVRTASFCSQDVFM